jgi:ribosomal protein L9
MSKSGIHLKEANKGKFTLYCKRKGYGSVTNECIANAKKSNNATLVKRATFASNAKHWSKG